MANSLTYVMQFSSIHSFVHSHAYIAHLSALFCVSFSMSVFYLWRIIESVLLCDVSFDSLYMNLVANKRRHYISLTQKVSSSGDPYVIRTKDAFVLLMIVCDAL